ncbi:protein C3orf33 homolog [Colossoma macropomum]|uniref:protein C3orf33 homolog n=1 Tax=Colossoma macropomum TaxID=42526 RepID=UPI001865203D|nr:protein C3orf33 homolog [Colossoma macropomum]
MPDSGADKKEKDEQQQSLNIVTVVSKFADENLTLVRNISTGLAVAGVLIIARSIRLITKFSSPSEIPARFIERSISIRGRVRSVTEKGLEVEHIPIYVPLVSPLLTKRQPVAPLDVRLAGVELTPQGWDWLSERLRPPQTVWLRLISRQDQSLHCLVSVSRGSLFNTCVNEEVLRLGLGRTAPLQGLDPHSRLYLKLHRRLLKSELKAERKGEGLWKEESLRERLTRALSNNMVVKTVKRVLKWMSGVKDR